VDSRDAHLWLRKVGFCERRGVLQIPLWAEVQELY
jgi:hypothetical protein